MSPGFKVTIDLEGQFIETQDNKELFAPIGCEVQFIDNPQAISSAATWSNQQVDNPIYLTLLHYYLSYHSLHTHLI